MKPTWKKYLLYASLIMIGGGLAFILVQTVRAKNTGFETKTLWDWMELLIIPLFLAGGAFFLNQSERVIERQIAEERAKLEREIALDRQQEAALQAYFDRMSELLLEKKLRTTKKTEVNDLARTRTLTILRRLDAKRKGLVIKFLYEAGLIYNTRTVVDMSDADLKDIYLSGAHLQGVNLAGADLENAILEYSNLENATLAGVNLNNAWLLSADLENIDLQGAELDGARLNYAMLKGTDLSGAHLVHTNLSNAILENATLESAYLNWANLRYASLLNADLSNAFLYDADLRDAKLEDANLQGATLRNATLPDGTIHE